ncbi:MAG TPA: type II toxin-antitoxin system HigB family toxin [Chthoniobacterales bacterium]|nr:type II toxin-antitoxin system HigB family toxin [Chthoniobacterales bacterium]
MRIISPSTIKEYSEQHPKAAGALTSWTTIVEGSTWKTPMDVKATINSVDTYVTEKLKRILHIFNICGNDYRLICAIHFPKRDWQPGWVYVREFLTHKEYDRGTWKASNDKI